MSINDDTPKAMYPKRRRYWPFYEIQRIAVTLATLSVATLVVTAEIWLVIHV
jgi:hypothetical protein